MKKKYICMVHAARVPPFKATFSLESLETLVHTVLDAGTS